MSKIYVDEIAGIASPSTVAIPGHVIQVAQDTSYAQTVISSTSWTDTTLSVTMTPKSASSKFLISFAFENIYFQGGNRGVSFRIVRNGTSLFTPSAGYAIWNNDASGDHKGYSNIFLDESSHTLDPLTFTLEVAGYNTSTIDLNDGGAFKDTLIVQEIAG